MLLLEPVSTDFSLPVSVFTFSKSVGLGGMSRPGSASIPFKNSSSEEKKIINSFIGLVDQIWLIKVVVCVSVK